MKLSTYGKITITTLREMADQAGYDVYKAPRSTWESVSSKKYNDNFNYVVVKGKYTKALGSAKNVYNFFQTVLTPIY